VPVRVAVVPHTHWDREWYEPFQSFRLRLVDTLDAVLELLERDPSYTRFLLDGQMAAVDDYLEVRPEAEERLRALATSGRLELGPWYALMDEFLISGETIVRDLQMGMRRAAAFGGSMRVGYLPDMFGHIAQMPQLLRLAGFEHAVVWRGVPSQITKSAFMWEAPDGSSVRAEYLPFGYGNGALLPDDAKSLIRRVADHASEMEPFLIGDLLLMNGSDHLPPQPDLGRVLAEANQIQEDFRFEISALSEHVASAPAPTGGLERWFGELRSGARANMLMGVTSNRVDVKRATARTERALERRAEPFAALFLPPAEWPTALLNLAWTGVVRNAAHDSICACSVDEVVDAVLLRTAESRRIAEGVADRALRRLAGSMSFRGPMVVNPAPRPRSGIVEVVVGDAGIRGAGSTGAHPGDEAVTDREARGAQISEWELPDGPDVQVVSERPPLPEMVVLDAHTARTVVAAIDGSRLDEDAWVHDVVIAEDDSGFDVHVTLGPDERGGHSVAEAKAQLLARLSARPSAAVRVRLGQPRIRRLVARVVEVPGFGWRPIEAAPLDHPVTLCEVEDGVAVSNGLVTLTVDETAGTFSVDGVGGMGRIVDGGDLGDSYNYSPPVHDVVVDVPEAVTLQVAERGPVRARVVVTAWYRWPDHAETSSQHRKGEQEVEVRTVLEVRADEPTVHVVTSFVNPSRDHRVRVHVPLPERASFSEAECAFGMVRRGLDAEGRPEERGLPTFPARRFLRAGGLTVVFDGVTEYELVEVDEREPPTAGAVALTLLRATGMLSRLGMSFRPFPAGPLIPVEGLQMVGRPIELRYAVCTRDVDPWALADDVLLPLEVIRGEGTGRRTPTGTALEVTGAKVSAVRRSGPLLEIRVFNPQDAETVVGLGQRSGWLVDLRGEPVEAVDSSFRLRPYGIATVLVSSG